MAAKTTTAKKATATKKAAPKATDDPTPDSTSERSWLDPDTEEPYPIHELLGMILNDLPAIGKDRVNRDQNFNFRGHDDVLREINPLFSKYRVVPIPTVLDRVTDRRTTRNGGIQYEVNLHVRYTFYGPAGDELSADAWGEGVDSGDKATNKAMTNAMKNVLNQTFAIATEEASKWDSDTTTPEETVAAPPAPATVTCAVCDADPEAQSPVFPAPADDPEPLRAHMVEVHGWVRQEDGKVHKPADEPTAPESAPTPPSDPEPAPAPPTPDETPQDETATEPADASGTSAVPEDELAWVDNLRGEALVAQMRKLNLPIGGRVADMRERLKDFLRGGDTGTDDTPDPVEEEDGNAEDIPEEPAASKEVENYPDDGFQCPECDVFPFATEEEYTDHWYAAHGDADEDEDEEDGGVEVSPESYAELKALVSGLRGQAARAYGDYRRKSKMPTKIDDLTGEQVIAALEFIESLEGIDG